MEQTNKQNNVALRVYRYFSLLFALFSHVSGFIFVFFLRIVLPFFPGTTSALTKTLPVSNIRCTLLGKKRWKSDTQAKKGEHKANKDRTNSEKQATHTHTHASSNFFHSIFSLYFHFLFALFSLLFLLLFCIFVCFWFAFAHFISHKLFDGWSCMAAIAQHNYIL